MKPRLPLVAGGCALLVAAPLAAQDQERATDVEITAHIYEPAKLQPTGERVGSLTLPDGFRIDTFAEGLGKPRIIAAAEDGTVYVTRREPGDVLMLRDTNGDGRADQQQVAARKPQLHGIALRDGRAYLAAVREVYVADIQNDGTFGELKPIIQDLPDGGQHPNRTLGFGPDGMLYITVGSTCNACDETNDRNATVLRAKPDGSGVEIFASGLRNTVGFGWHPETGEMYGLDHGIDWLGDEEPKEELNRLAEGKKYGWPYINADGRRNPQDEPPGGVTMEQWAAESEEPVLLHTAHAAPMQMAFYTGAQFPEDYRGDAFAAMRGSWNRKPPSGYEVVRVRFEDGKPAGIEPFVTGFLTQREDGAFGYFARPVGLAVDNDGALLIGDDANGVIYRVSYGEARQTAQRAAGPAGSGEPMETAGGDRPEPIYALPETEAPESVTVRSDALEDGGSIPQRFTAYGDGVAPPLAWSGLPEETRSLVLVVEDPDVSWPKPAVHWLMYNMPADVESLPQGASASNGGGEPDGAREGKTSRGIVGYAGPRPPKDGPPHHYHFQVFALDTMLDLPNGADREQLLAAMDGHVLAKGRLVGRFQAPSG